jgi:hypothetical protein
MPSEVFSVADPLTLSDDELFHVLTATRGGELTERRATPRHPCFAPVSLSPSGNTRQCLSAFSRDVSRDGVGLLHSMQLNRGAIYTVVLKHPAGELRQHAQVMWCRPMGEGWYVSGLRFVKVSH